MKMGSTQPLSLRRAGSKVYSDERILGSSEFVKKVIADAEKKTKETLRLSLKISDLPFLARKKTREKNKGQTYTLHRGIYNVLNYST